MLIILTIMLSEVSEVEVSHEMANRFRENLSAYNVLVYKNLPDQYWSVEIEG